MACLAPKGISTRTASFNLDRFVIEAVMFSVTTSFLMGAAYVVCCVYFIHHDRDPRATSPIQPPLRVDMPAMSATGPR
jgi:hypothetical protein